MPLVTPEEFREWSGANLPASVPDTLIADSLAEAEAALLAEVNLSSVAELAMNPAAEAIARGDEMRRASRLLARRNSPEAVAGVGSEGIIAIPSRDPDSAAAVRQIRAILLVPEGVA